MRLTHTPHGVRFPSAGLTNVTLGLVALLLCATLTRPVHGVAALLCVVLLVLRLERAE